MLIVRHLVSAVTALRATWRSCGAGALALALLIFASGAQAQTLPGSEIDTAAISATPDLTASRIKSKIDEIEARKDLAVALRDQALALYRKALSQLEAAAANSSAAARFQDAIKESPKRTAEVK